ncbi:hypothetical protein GCM10022235_39220 [Kribbella ginsengisoli]|uniref:Uncharacterized protein n=1 Tax=Kribbella ginsengisoli TaxID=363865 RepID=A0ABP6XH89_9ACTN
MRLGRRSCDTRSQPNRGKHANDGERTQYRLAHVPPARLPPDQPAPRRQPDWAQQMKHQRPHPSAPSASINATPGLSRRSENTNASLGDHQETHW